MTIDQMDDVLTIYEKKMAELLDDAWAMNEHIRHASTMLPKMRGFLREAREEAGIPSRKAWEKLNRWLGWLQCTFWVHKIYTLDEMKKHNSTP